MDRRLLLHEMLCELLASFGIWFWDPFNFQSDSLQDAINKEARKHVYFDPPSGFCMTYPCIVYRRSKIDPKFANNKPYLLTKKYEITVIDKDPDSMIPDKVAMLPRCAHDRNFVSDNLHHDVFTLEF